MRTQLPPQSNQNAVYYLGSLASVSDLPEFPMMLDDYHIPMYLIVSDELFPEVTTVWWDDAVAGWKIWPKTTTIQETSEMFAARAAIELKEVKDNLAKIMRHLGIED
jgi:hypothetical protein